MLDGIRAEGQWLSIVDQVRMVLDWRELDDPDSLCRMHVATVAGGLIRAVITPIGSSEDETRYITRVTWEAHRKEFRTNDETSLYTAKRSAELGVRLIFAELIQNLLVSSGESGDTPSDLQECKTRIIENRLLVG